MELYHGSPYRSSSLLSDYETKRKGVFFLTGSKSAAKDYTKPLMSAGAKPQKARHTDDPTIYKVKVKLTPDSIFDIRKPVHQKLWDEMRKEYNSTRDPEDHIGRDLMMTPHVPDDKHGGGGELPNWGSCVALVPLLKTRGFKGAWFSEGSQGASLSVFNPKEDVEIIGATDPVGKPVDIGTQSHGGGHPPDCQCPFHGGHAKKQEETTVAHDAHMMEALDAKLGASRLYVGLVEGEEPDWAELAKALKIKPQMSTSEIGDHLRGLGMDGLVNKAVELAYAARGDKMPGKSDEPKKDKPTDPAEPGKSEKPGISSDDYDHARAGLSKGQEPDAFDRAAGKAATAEPERDAFDKAAWDAGMKKDEPEEPRGAAADRIVKAQQDAWQNEPRRVAQQSKKPKPTGDDDDDDYPLPRKGPVDGPRKPAPKDDGARGDAKPTGKKGKSSGKPAAKGRGSGKTCGAKTSRGGQCKCRTAAGAKRCWRHGKSEGVIDRARHTELLHVEAISQLVTALIKNMDEGDDASLPERSNLIADVQFVLREHQMPMSETTLLSWLASVAEEVVPAEDDAGRAKNEFDLIPPAKV